MSKFFNWTNDIKNFIMKNYKGVGPSEMAVRVSKKFNVNATRSIVKGFYSRNHLNSGVTGYFKKGNIPNNKGKKQSEFLTPEAIERTKATRFQKGNLPPNTKPIGYERITQDGYIEVKIKMRPSRKDCNDNFKAKHIIEWEKHNGPVPKGMVLRFLDGNKQNCSIDNLELVTKAENLQITRKNLSSSNPEITRAGIAIAKLSVATSERRNDKNHIYIKNQKEI